MTYLEGVRSPEKRRDRLTLSVRDPNIEKLVAGLDIDGISIDQLRRIGKNLWRWRNDWSVKVASRRRREVRGLFASKGGE